MNIDRPCAECVHGRRRYGALRCLRGITNIDTNAITGAPFCEVERRGGRMWAWLTSACGVDGWHFRARSGERVPNVTPTTLYVAIHDDGQRVSGYVFGTAKERDDAIAQLLVEGLYAPATVEVLEQVP